MPTNARNTWWAPMKATNAKTTESVGTGDSSTSTGPSCSLFISTPSPFERSGGEPSVSKSVVFALASKHKGQERQQGNKISLSSHQLFDQTDQCKITVETSATKPLQGSLSFQEDGHHKLVFYPLQASKCQQHSSVASSEVMVPRHPH